MNSTMFVSNGKSCLEVRGKTTENRTKKEKNIDVTLTSFDKILNTVAGVGWGGEKEKERWIQELAESKECWKKKG